MGLLDDKDDDNKSTDIKKKPGEIIEGAAVNSETSMDVSFIEDFDKNQLSNIAPYSRTKRYELKKHVGAIHTSSRMTLVQHQVNDFLLLNAFDNLLSQEIHKIPLRDIRDYLGSNSNNTEFIKDTLDALKNYPIKWNVLDDSGNEDWVSSSVIAEARIRDGWVYYVYGPFLRERLASPEVYALLDLRIQQSFSTEHALKLWENCYRFVKVGSTGEISLEKWKEILLQGDPVQSYPEFKDFKRYVLTPAIEQVNTISNIRITPHYIKEPAGRKVAAIRFDIEQANQSSLNLIGQFEVDDEIVEILVEEFGITQEKATQVASGYPKEYIMEKVDNARSQKGNKNIKSLGGFLIRSLEMDYKIVRRKAKTTPSAAEATEEKQKQALNKDFNKFKEDSVNQYLDALSLESKEELEKEFVESLNSTVMSMYKKRGMESGIVIKEYFNFVANVKIGKEALVAKSHEFNQ